MEGCTVEVTTAGQSAVELAGIHVAAAGRLATGGSTSTIIFVDNDYRLEFPVDTWIYHPTSETWHQVDSVVHYESDTTVTMKDAAADTWDAETVRAAWTVGRLTDDGGGDTDTFVFTGEDYTLEFPAGTWIWHPTSDNWYRVESVAYAAGDTTVEMVTPADHTWEDEIVHPTVIARLFNNSLRTVDTAAVAAPASEAPVLMAHNRLAVDITADVKNQVGTPYNAVDADMSV